MATTGYRWFRAGDLNGFFALMFDNVANLVILASILIGAFGFPSQIVLYRMIPGTAIGVLAGDLFYSWMAGRLAKAEGRDDVTAMPLGLNAPSIFGMSFGVLGPAYLATHDAELAWKMGMAVTVLVGVFKIGLSFFGNAVRRALPRAALLGSIGGAGLALIALLPMLKVYADPIPGLLAFGVILVALVGNIKIPGKVPGALASALVGMAAFYFLRAAHIVSPLAAPTEGGPSAMHLSFPWPTVAFASGLSLAWAYLPIILPFSLSTVVGGIDNTESAAAAGDVYDTRTILLTEGFCTVLAGLCGGVVESTPYIGHPAYKSMGSGAGYTILTGLFIGLGGILGYLPFFVAWIPAAAIAPILVYIGLEVVSQAYQATPASHGFAVAISLLPSLAFLIALEVTAALGAVGANAGQLTGDVGETIRTVILLGNGFIISALIWGAATAEMIDRRFGRSAWCLVAGAVACLFGVIHSPAAQGTFVLPWRAGSPLPWHFAFGYLGAALVIFVAKFFPNAGEMDALP
ncbi:MAG TPA: MFS transporter [Verrucomicrobiae bacterium]|nr:MFS transporter [Verrucomicrobiae bacterium]